MVKWIIGILALLLVAGGALGYWLFGKQQAELKATHEQLVEARQDAAEYRRRAADLDAVREQLEQASAGSGTSSGSRWSTRSSSIPERRTSSRRVSRS
jgi:uncharacterized protein HemX